METTYEVRWWGYNVFSGNAYHDSMTFYTKEDMDKFVSELLQKDNVTEIWKETRVLEKIEIKKNFLDFLENF